jgi:protein farnesyltransferase subunit beta
MKNKLRYEKEGSTSGLNLVDKETGKPAVYTKCSEVNPSLPGSMQIHENGEMDMRGVYCALVIADILNILDDNEELRSGMGEFIASC